MSSSLLVPAGLCAVGLLWPNKTARRTITASLFAKAFYDIVLAPAANPRNGMYDAHTIMTAVLLASDLLVLHDPENDFSNQDGKVFQLPGLNWTKIKWAMDLSVNFRGIGWNFEPKHLWTSAGKKETRLQYVLRQILGAGGCLLAIDLAQTLYRHRPTCSTGGSVFADSFAWQVVYNVAEWVHMAGAMILMQKVAAIVTVPLHIYSPEDWPDIFGSIRNAYTVRKFWGKTWHQLHRHFLTTHAKFFAQDILHLPRGSKLRTYVELLTVFFISGIVHAAGAYAFLRTGSGAAASLAFFTLQGVCIMLEDQVILLGKRLGLKDTVWTRAIGYAWLVTWIAVSNPIRAESLVKGGLWDQAQQPQLRIVEGLLGRLKAIVPVVAKASAA